MFIVAVPSSPLKQDTNVEEIPLTGFRNKFGGFNNK
jgi:hypothetical protein